MGSLDDGGLDELLYTQRLADNDDVIRSRTLKKLNKFLNLKSQQKGFLYEDMIKIWKGLYYCMYMSDKPLVQEELAEDISCLIHQFSNNSQKFLFFKVALDTFAREWNGIDKFRMDKFFMLFTRVLRQCLFCLQNVHWNIDEVKKIAEILESSIICPYDEANKTPLGLKIHLVSVILVELSKVAKESLPDKALITILYPFFKVIAVSRQSLYIKAIRNHILDILIKQSKLGIKHQEDLTLNEIELAKGEDEDSSEEAAEDEEEEFVMDPRAGGVDVYLPLLKPNYKSIANALQSVGSIAEVPRKNRHQLFCHVKQFLKMAKNSYPFANPIGKSFDLTKTNRKSIVRKAVRELMNSEVSDETSRKRKLEDSSEEIAIPRKKKKRTKHTKSKLSKEESKRQARRASKKKSALKAKLNRIDRILDSAVETPLDKKETPNQAISSGNSEFQVTPKRRLKKTMKASQNKGWQVKDLGFNVPNKVSVRKAKKAKDICKKNVDVTEALKRSRDKRASHVPEQNNSLETQQNSRRSGTPTGKRNKKTSTAVLGHNATVVVAGKTEKQIDGNAGKGNTATQHTVNIHQNARPKKDFEKGLQKTYKLTLTKKQKKLTKGSVTENINNISTLKTGRGSNSSKKAEKVSLKATGQNDPWKEDLKEGETEIVIISKKYAKKKKLPKRLNMVIEKTPKMNTKGKTLKINLRKNEEHDWKDYREVLKSSPGIPFSANKRPPSSALKSSASRNVKRKSCKARINSIKSKYNLP